MPKKGYKQTEETKRKIALAHTGFKQTSEHIKKRIEARRKNNTYNQSDEAKVKIGLAGKGRKMPEHVKLNLAKINTGNKYNLGRKQSIETRRKMSQVHKKRVELGLNNFYKGGISKINIQIRNSFEYTLWREAVFKRDNWTCVWCLRSKEVSGRLQADHIKPFAHYPELRFAIDNGRTLCKDCHEKTDTYLWKTRVNK